MSTKSRLFNILGITKNPIMLIGIHGIGKSEMIAEFARLVGKPLVDIRLSQYSAGDFIGMPWPDHENKSTVFYPPELLQLVSREPCILFLDELNRAQLDVRQAVFQIADSRRLGSLVLHPETVVVAAINPDDLEYLVKPLDPAERDRWMFFDFKPSPDEWLEWAASVQVHPQIIEYIKNNKANLDPPNSGSDTLEKHPSRRSWKRLSDDLKKNPSVETIFDLAVGQLGHAVGSRFAAQFKNVQKVINPFEAPVNLGSASQEEFMRVMAFLSERNNYKSTDGTKVKNLLKSVDSISNNERRKAVLQSIRDTAPIDWFSTVSKDNPEFVQHIYF